MREREREAVETIFIFSGFTDAIGAHYIFEEVAGFSPLWFPRGKTLCSFSLVFDCCVVLLS